MYALRSSIAPKGDRQGVGRVCARIRASLRSSATRISNRQSITRSRPQSSVLAAILGGPEGRPLGGNHCVKTHPFQLRSSVAQEGDRQREQRISQFLSLSAVVILGRPEGRPPARLCRPASHGASGCDPCDFR